MLVPFHSMTKNLSYSMHLKLRIVVEFSCTIKTKVLAGEAAFLSVVFFFANIIWETFY